MEVRVADFADLVVFVYCIHAVIALILGDDLACIFNNNLVRLETPHGSYAVPAIRSFEYLNTNVVPISMLGSLA